MVLIPYEGDLIVGVLWSSLCGNYESGSRVKGLAQLL